MSGSGGPRLSNKEVEEIASGRTRIIQRTRLKPKKEIGGKKKRRKMRKGGSKQKGSTFERKVCKQLSLWISHGERDDLFWRSAMSGGRASVKFKRGGKNQTQVGDISAIDPLGAKLTSIFVIECKHYRDLGIDTLVGKGKGTLLKFWNVLKKQCVKASDSQHRLEPMLIARQNRMPVLLCLSSAGYVILGSKGDPHRRAFIPDLNMSVCDLNGFLRDVPCPL